jgi:hypothetical protein
MIPILDILRSRDMKRHVTTIFAALILATSAAPLWAQSATEKLAAGNYTVYARSPQVWRFIVDGKTMANASLSGHFAITEGTPKNIDVYVFDEANFKKWRNEDEATHTSAKPLYTSGRKADGDVMAKVTEPGIYYLVFSDSFAYEGTKGLSADVKLDYDKR